MQPKTSNDKLKRFNKRQEIKKNLRKNHVTSNKNIDIDLVDNLLNSKIDKNQISETENYLSKRFDFNFTDTIESPDKINELLVSIGEVYDKNKLNTLITESKNSILDNILTPFGIAKYVVAKYDIEGGNVDTISNVRKGVYATKEERLKSENNPKYNPDIYYSDKKYIQKNRNGKIKKIKGQLIDEYTGVKINANDKINLDHTKSAYEIHQDTGRILADLDDVKLANTETNLSFTLESINKSKKAKSMRKFIETTGNKDIEINKLSSKEKLSEKERKKLKRLIELNQIKPELAMAKDERVRREYENSINKNYYQSSKFLKNTVKSSAKQASRMGLQQAVGLVLKELTESIFDEVIDIFHNGFKGENKINETFFHVLQERLVRIGNRVLGKWKDVIKTFGEGLFSGFLSNLVTVIINIFKTTSKKVVRIIREGLFSLLKALKLLFFPPENITWRDAAHEATKLIVAGLSVTGGIMLEQYLDTLLKAFPFADTIVTVLVGIVTGLATSLLVFLLDRLDIFGVEHEKKYDFIIAELDRMIDSSIEESETILKSFEIRTIND